MSLVSELIGQNSLNMDSEDALDQFGKIEYRDPVVPVQILMVMMGFSLLLFNKIVQPSNYPLIIGASVFCGTAYLLAFMFYLTEYYEKLWEPYFLLPDDKLFFRLYSILVGFIVIAMMQNWPEYWSLYVIILFLVMYLKKAKTRNAYKNAVKRKFGNYDNCDNPVVKAKWVLSETFTLNFLWLGLILLLPFSLVMTLSVMLLKYPIVRNTIEPIIGLNFSDQFLIITYLITSVLITSLTLLFWKGKITRGIIEMKKKVEDGDYQYFETRDLRSRIRRRRHNYR